MAERVLPPQTTSNLEAAYANAERAEARRGEHERCLLLAQEICHELGIAQPMAAT